MSPTGRASKKGENSLLRQTLKHEPDRNQGLNLAPSGHRVLPRFQPFHPRPTYEIYRRLKAPNSVTSRSFSMFHAQISGLRPESNRLTGFFYRRQRRQGATLRGTIPLSP